MGRGRPGFEEGPADLVPALSFLSRDQEGGSTTYWAREALESGVAALSLRPHTCSVLALPLLKGTERLS